MREPISSVRVLCAIMSDDICIIRVSVALRHGCGCPPLNAYVSDNYSNASQIGTGFISPDRIVLRCQFFEVVVKLFMKKKRRRKRKERRKAGREQSRSLKGIERKMAVNSGYDFPGYDKKRDTIPIDRPTRTRNLAALVIQIEQCAFFFLSFHRPPTYVAKD